MKAFTKKLPYPRNRLDLRRFLSIQKEYDVIVNGGGIVGAAFASNLLRLTGGKIKIAILERQPIKPLKSKNDKPDIRVYALSPHSKQFLSTLNIWQHIEQRNKPYTSMQIWESLTPGGLRFNSQDIDAEALGFICEDSTLQSAIYRSFEDQNYHVDIINDYSLQNIAQNGEGKTMLNVELSNNQDKSKVFVQTR